MSFTKFLLPQVILHIIHLSGNDKQKTYSIHQPCLLPLKFQQCNSCRGSYDSDTHNNSYHPHGSGAPTNSYCSPTVQGPPKPTLTVPVVQAPPTTHVIVPVVNSEYLEIEKHDITQKEIKEIIRKTTEREYQISWKTETNDIETMRELTR